MTMKRKNLSMNKLLYVIPLFFFIGTTIYFSWQYYYLYNLQFGQIEDTFNIYSWALNDLSESSNEIDIVANLVYVYGYYPPGTKYIPSSSPLSNVIEQGRSGTILLLLHLLEKKTKAGFGCDIDKWVTTYGDNETVYCYNTMQEFRKEHELHFLFTPFICPCP